ncbi:MAG: hypothetical protein RR623_08895 [Bacilli bacterium]
MMKSIGIIVPYFGSLPNFFRAWTITAKANPTIDFFLFTDDISNIKSDGNIHVIPSTLDEVKERIEHVLDKQTLKSIVLSSPYKLCDFRPTYGLSFKDYLEGYDFWGYCDIDLLFGNIRKFITNDVLNYCDRYLLNGHLSLYKNCEKMNNLFKFQESGYPALNWQDVFFTADSMYFDEQRGMYTKCMLNQVNIVRETKTCDPITQEPLFYKGDITSNNQFIVFWKNGNLFMVNKDNHAQELLYAHFFRRKFIIESVPENINRIKVMPTKVVFNEEIKKSDFKLSEKSFYKICYYCSILKNSIKKYGLKKTLQRQRWSKDSNAYINEMIYKANNVK